MEKAVVARIEETKDRILVLTRTFDAPRELVFDAWTDAEHFAQWCAPANFEVIRNSADVRRGGVWWSLMQAPDGEECSVSGVYREVVASERLVFTYAHELPDSSHGPETLVTVIFEAIDGKTKLSLRQSVFDSVENCVAHSIGWSECLDRLAAQLSNAA